MGTAIAAIIGAIIAGGTAIYTGAKQSQAMNAAQGEARALNEREYANILGQQAESRRQFNQGFAENRRQFNQTMAVNQDNTAYSRLQTQVDRVNSVLANNNELENLLINRIRGIRGANA